MDPHGSVALVVGGAPDRTRYSPSRSLSARGGHQEPSAPGPDPVLPIPIPPHPGSSLQSLTTCPSVPGTTRTETGRTSAPARAQPPPGPGSTPPQPLPGGPGNRLDGDGTRAPLRFRGAGPPGRTWAPSVLTHRYPPPLLPKPLPRLAAAPSTVTVICGHTGGSGRGEGRTGPGPGTGGASPRLPRSSPGEPLRARRPKPPR